MAMQRRIFLVEDNPLIRTMLAEMLEELAGAQLVAWAESERGAIEAMQIVEWDVALVDLFLKEGSGLGVARAFMNRPAEQRLFVVSNYATNDMRERCKNYKVDGIFDKSTELDELLEALGAP
jgi:DNA-binding NarL/FixJ family response regulator